MFRFSFFKEGERLSWYLGVFPFKKKKKEKKKNQKQEVKVIIYFHLIRPGSRGEGGNEYISGGAGGRGGEGFFV